MWITEQKRVSNEEMRSLAGMRVSGDLGLTFAWFHGFHGPWSHHVIPIVYVWHGRHGYFRLLTHPDGSPSHSWSSWMWINPQSCGDFDPSDDIGWHIYDPNPCPWYWHMLNTPMLTPMYRSNTKPGFSYPLNKQFATLIAWPIEIYSWFTNLPIKNCDFPWFFIDQRDLGADPAGD